MQIVMKRRIIRARERLRKNIFYSPLGRPFGHQRVFSDIIHKIVGIHLQTGRRKVWAGKVSKHWSNTGE